MSNFFMAASLGEVLGPSLMAASTVRPVVVGLTVRQAAAEVARRS